MIGLTAVWPRWTAVQWILRFLTSVVACSVSWRLGHGAPALQCVEWSLALMANSAALRLRDVEKAAKAERRAIWTNYVPAPTNQTKLSDNYTGKVCWG